MLQRVAFWGLVLLATPIVSAQDTIESSNALNRQQTNARPAQNAPRVTSVATREEQQRLLRHKCAEMDRLQREIMRLREATGTAQQILVKVQMLEVSLTKLRDMDIDTTWFANGCVSGAETRKLLDFIAARADTALVTTVDELESTGNLRFVGWLRRNNLAKVLTEPTLVS